MDPLYCSVYNKKNIALDYYDNFLSVEQAGILFEYLDKTCEWSNSGNKRANCNYGDDGISYKLEFGRGDEKKVITRKVKPWLKVLFDIKTDISNITGSEYNYCVVQRYPNGNIHIPPHRDREIQSGTIIAGLSLGATRLLSMDPPKWIKEEPIKVQLKSGSLYVMNPPTNDYWSHSIIKDSTILSSRISVTYRLNA